MVQVCPGVVALWPPALGAVVATGAVVGRRVLMGRGVAVATGRGVAVGSIWRPGSTCAWVGSGCTTIVWLLLQLLIRKNARIRSPQSRSSPIPPPAAARVPPGMWKPPPLPGGVTPPPPPEGTYPPPPPDGAPPPPDGVPLSSREGASARSRCEGSWSVRRRRPARTVRSGSSAIRSQLPGVSLGAL